MADIDLAQASPSPATLARSVGIEASDGPAGDASIDRALVELDSAVKDFGAPTLDGAEEEDTSDTRGPASEEFPDAAPVLLAGRHLHDILQQRLDEAAG